jgi:hypothetical protein
MEYFLFENNIINIKQYIEINKFYSKYQQSERIINYLKTKTYESKEFNRLLQLVNSIGECKNLENDTEYKYKLNILYIDEFIIIEETINIEEKILFRKDHVFYSIQF